ncbi:MAG: hypothetical protein LR011_01185 [Verrucomicrobia bacterium]|nr:hypothetical protein [Verrucomicrobiota bacterium]
MLDTGAELFHDWNYTDYEADRARDEAAAQEVFERFQTVFGLAVEHLRARLGEPIRIQTRWSEDLPYWVSSSLFALWHVGDDFLNIFMAYDNPEDPPFLIVAKANRNELASEYSDPWNSQWMIDYYDEPE